ncbi:MAG: hypothetical protein R3F60_15280 [bacterium]
MATTAMAIQRLIRLADREEHSIRYALLLSIADHRTIDFLRRRRPEYRGTMDDRPRVRATSRGRGRRTGAIPSGACCAPTATCWPWPCATP